MKNLTKRQKEILNFIASMVEKHGYPPTLREICKKFAIVSTNGARYHLYRLQELGYLEVETCKSRGMKLKNEPSKPVNQGLGFDLPLLGQVPAGPMDYAAQDLYDENLKINHAFFGINNAESKVYGLRVKGDSMVNAGIQDRDIVVVRSQQRAKNGDIVVARIGKDVTIKRFRSRIAEILLEPENPAYETIRIPDLGCGDYGQDFAILGQIVGVIRTLG